MSNRDRRTEHDERWTRPGAGAAALHRRLRIALYSHDTMGLGHMRRNLLLAQALMRSPEPPSVLMVAGAREAGALRLPRGVDSVTLPALAKDGDGGLGARDLDLSLAEIVRLRSRIIAAAIEAYQPDVFIVDKVPRGAMRELVPALDGLAAEGRCRCVLGLRDILDDPETVRREWREMECDDAIRRYYRAVWVYGDPRLYDPVPEYGFSPVVVGKVRYTGYLDQRTRLAGGGSECVAPSDVPDLPEGRLVLCLLGGGQDGAALSEAFAHAELPEGSVGVLVMGPYLPAEARAQVRRAAASRPQLRIVESLAEPGWLLRRADRVIAMGGYNTVCEILSFERTALIVPRIHPRREQLIRAERLRAHGLIDMLHPGDLTPEALGRWLSLDLPPRPSASHRFDWNGLDNVPRFVGDLFNDPPSEPWYLCTEKEVNRCHAIHPSASATW
ncbi:MAG: glycosyltransferase family protein [Isosphaeraceae bacterium]